MDKREIEINQKKDQVRRSEALHKKEKRSLLRILACKKCSIEETKKRFNQKMQDIVQTIKKPTPESRKREVDYVPRKTER